MFKIKVKIRAGVVINMRKSIMKVINLKMFIKM